MFRYHFVVTLVVLSSLISAPKMLGADTSGDADMVNFDLGVSWSSPWQITDYDSNFGELDLIELRHGRDNYYSTVIVFDSDESDGKKIAERVIGEFFEDMPEFEVVQEWSPGGAGGPFPAIVKYVEGTVRLTAQVTSFSLGRGNGAYAHITKYSSEFLPETRRTMDALLSYRFPWDDYWRYNDRTPPVLRQDFIESAEALAELLRKSQFTQDELGWQCCPSPQPSNGSGEPIEIVFDLKEPGVNQGIGYWVYSTSTFAWHDFWFAMANKQADFPVREDLSELMLAPAIRLSSDTGYVSGCFILIGNVVAFGSSVGATGYPSNADRACNLAMAAVVHWANVLS